MKTSSKTCNVCGYKYQDLTEKIREWQCPDCGINHDRG
ncbi:transposase [Methanosarcina sp. DH2]|nr:transposase [Methanosarcina sp. DH2]MCC4770402.1 transposase [Methanosarcina sp. DH2]